MSVATLRGEQGDPWALEWWQGRPERKSFRDGTLLRFAYRLETSARVDTALVGEVISALSGVEADLVALGPAGAWPRAATGDGRVIFVDETGLASAVARRLLRGRSVRAAVYEVLDRQAASGPPVGQVHFYLEARCEQACEFCEEPARRQTALGRLGAAGRGAQYALGADLVSQGALDAILEWAHLREEPIAVQITGHDWMRHPHLDALFESLERNPGVALRLQGPSLDLRSRALATRVAALPFLDLVTTTLQSSVAAEHDAMVGRPGAHACLLEALATLAEVGVTVRLALVLTRRAVRTLGATLAWLHEHGRAAQLHAFVPDRAMAGAEDALAPLGELRAALAGVPSSCHDAVSAIVGVPPCAVPPALRSKVAPAIDTPQRDAAAYAEGCESCAARTDCPGVPARYLARFGARDLVALSAR